MERQVFAGTDKGRVRENNQDRYETGLLFEDRLSFAVLCDGMGGENGGEIASKIATEFALKALERDLTLEMTEFSIHAVFSSIFAAANALIFEQGSKDEKLKGMGTTMILAVIQNHRIYIGSVGDSRAYLVDKEETVQITKDHTIVQMMVDKGELEPKAAAKHPKRHFITRAVGVGDSVEMDFYVHSLREKQGLLLCSDGFYSYAPLDTLYALVEETVENQSVQNLLDHANQAGGADNITTIVMI